MAPPSTTMLTRLIFAALAASPVALAQISTFTRYGGGCTTNQGACGDPIGNGYTAALSQAQFGDSYKGPACGTCYELTINDNLYGEHPDRTITVTVDNECPAEGNSQWCQVPNEHGAAIHFDLCDESGAADALLGPGGGTGKGVARKVDCASGARQDGGEGGGTGGSGNGTASAAPIASSTPAGGPMGSPAEPVGPIGTPGAPMGTPVAQGVSGVGGLSGTKCKRSGRAAKGEQKMKRQAKPWTRGEMLGV
ncbi:MAG: hypothetical protein M1831_005553 [Alyxoria varia]|nr:MAG: hypothetical protein M1831_005553 [Alyxoria varia]